MAERQKGAPAYNTSLSMKAAGLGGAVEST